MAALTRELRKSDTLIVTGNQGGDILEITCVDKDKLGNMKLSLKLGRCCVWHFENKEITAEKLIKVLSDASDRGEL